jgi:hypothetical protein
MKNILIVSGRKKVDEIRNVPNDEEERCFPIVNLAGPKQSNDFYIYLTRKKERQKI